LKRKISLTKFVLLISFINTLLYQIALYQYVINKLDIFTQSGFLTLLSVIIATFTITVTLFFLIAFISKKLLQFFVTICFIANSIALYFVLTYNVILDKSMMGNVFNTKFIEASAYFDLKIIFYIIFLGLFPSIFINRFIIINIKKLKLLIYSIFTFIFGLFLLYLNSFTWLWLDKNAKILGGLIMPWSYSINAIRVELKKYKENKKQILLPDGKFLDNKKIIVVLVIGESARADRFFLYGNKKNTNPNLSKIKNLFVLKNTISTDTYTTASVSSILSFEGKEFDEHEPLTNYLHRMGAYVEWRSNNWGEPKQVIDKYIQAGELKRYCVGERCEYDEVLLINLKKSILEAKKNKIFIVLHTTGSHGPQYYRKYPKSFEKFKPVCKSVDLKQCTKKELFNAYDNTILYTDYFLAKTIKILDNLNLPVLFLYISDHGESLGEYNLYLHGTPYFMAPKYQKEIPFLIWESDEFIKQRGWEKAYIKKEVKYSQKYIFHTVIKALGIKTPIYNKKYDLLDKDSQKF